MKTKLFHEHKADVYTKSITNDNFMKLGLTTEEEAAAMRRWQKQQRNSLEW